MIRGVHVRNSGQAKKSAWWMLWYQEAMKDVARLR